jgi:hypothetical protein
MRYICNNCGGEGCPACRYHCDEEVPEVFRCHWCGEEFPEEEKMWYGSKPCCPECHKTQKEEDKAAADAFLSNNPLFQVIKLF